MLFALCSYKELVRPWRSKPVSPAPRVVGWEATEDPEEPLCWPEKHPCRHHVDTTPGGVFLKQERGDMTATEVQSTPAASSVTAQRNGSGFVMVDPAGRFFDNVVGAHSYSRPILDVGVEEALKDVSMDARKFLSRSGIYAW